MARHVKQFALVLEGKSPTDDRSFTVTLYDASELDRDGETIDLYTVRAREPIPVQIDHDRSVLKTVGTVSRIHAEGSRLRGVLTFAPDGVSDTADQVYRQVRTGITPTVSISFLGKETRTPEGHVRWTNVEVVELSFVSVPSSPGARVDQKALERWLRDGRDDVVLELSDAPAEVLELADAFGDDVVLELRDDHPLDAFRRDIAACAGAAARAALRSHGFTVTDPPADPAARHRDALIEVDERQVQRLVAETVREVIGGVARAAAVSTINRLRGLLD